MIRKFHDKKTFRSIVHDSCALIYHAAGEDVLREIQCKLVATDSPDDCLYLLAKSVMRSVNKSIRES
jgi:hypothetical protein